jgi:selenocysteine lyase/cysteine desulfurase
MRAVELPPGDPDELWARRYDEFRVEAPVYEWEGRRLLRISVRPYTDEDDVERLVTALGSLTRSRDALS